MGSPRRNQVRRRSEQPAAAQSPSAQPSSSATRCSGEFQVLMRNVNVMSFGTGGSSSSKDSSYGFSGMNNVVSSPVSEVEENGVKLRRRIYIYSRSCKKRLIRPGILTQQPSLFGGKARLGVSGGTSLTGRPGTPSIRIKSTKIAG